MNEQFPTTAMLYRWRQQILVVAVAVGLLIFLQIGFQWELARWGIIVRLGDVVLFGYCVSLAIRLARDCRRRDQPSPISTSGFVTLVALLIAATLIIPFAWLWPQGWAGHFSLSILLKFPLLYIMGRAFEKLQEAHRVAASWRPAALSPATTVVLSFVVAIVVGTVLLSLPEASAGGKYIAPLDALFTATSATCVTGLIVKDTPHDFSPLGKLVIILLVQAGGLGIMTLSAVFGTLLGRRFSLHHRMALRETLMARAGHHPGRIIGGIVAFTLLMEALGAAVLFHRWLALGEPPSTALGLAAFHSVSAFCNAGFSLFSDSLLQYAGDPVINLAVLSLIVVGGLGFPVVLDIYQYLRDLRRARRPSLSLHSKLVITTTALLIGAGFVLFLGLEAGGILRDKPAATALWIAAFQAITPRTAGFNTVPIGHLRDATLLLLATLMFIGASPGSTGGGIKTSTFATLVLVIRSMIRGERQCQVWGRTIPAAVYQRAFAVFALMLTALITFTFLLTLTEGYHFLSLLFEAASALGTVGLTTGITPTLSNIGRLLITVAMFIGRVGPLTLAVAIRPRVRAATYTFPDEDIMVG